jgi:tetratricopeptide (TPR) repeat protein
MPGSAAAAKLATEALGQAGRIEEAIAMATKWRSLAPSDDKSVDFVQARLKCLRGQVEDARGQFKNARSQFEDAVKILKPYEEQILAAAKDRPDDLELYASALASAGQVDKAVQVVGDRFRLDSDWVVRYLRIGEAMMNQPDLARIWLSRLDLSGDASGELLLVAARAWCKLGAKSGRSTDMDEGVGYATRAASYPKLAVPRTRSLPMDTPNRERWSSPSKPTALP